MAKPLLALGWLVGMPSIGAAVAYGYTSLAAFRAALREGHAATMATGLLGVALSLAFVVLLLVPILGLSSSLGMESYVCLAVWVVHGAVFYWRTGKRRCEDDAGNSRRAASSPIETPLVDTRRNRYYQRVPARCRTKELLQGATPRAGPRNPLQ